MAWIAKHEIWHNKNRFNKGQEVTGLSASDANRLETLGAIEKFDGVRASDVVDADNAATIAALKAQADLLAKENLDLRVKSAKDAADNAESAAVAAEAEAKGAADRVKAKDTDENKKALKEAESKAAEMREKAETAKHSLAELMGA